MLKPTPFVQKMGAYRPPTEGRRGKVRLDFNENTVGVSADVLNAIRARLTPELLATYPEYGPLRSLLAKRLGVRESQLVLCNGTDEGLHLVMQTFLNPGDTLGLVEPAYAMARFYGELVGAQVLAGKFDDVPVEGLRRRFEVRDDDLRAIAQKSRVLYLASPNNPTGSALSLDTIAQVLAEAPQTCVLVDEAYFEFHEQTALDLLDQYRNLVVCRTFSKALGLAGLRVGTLVTNTENAAWLRKGQSPYSVNAMAVLAAEELLRGEDPARTYVREIQAERGRVMDALENLGLTHWESAGNFILFQAGDDCDSLLQAAAEAGVLIRDRRHDWPGCLRVTIGTTAQNDQFLTLVGEQR